MRDLVRRFGVDDPADIAGSILARLHRIDPAARLVVGRELLEAVADGLEPDHMTAILASEGDGCAPVGGDHPDTPLAVELFGAAARLALAADESRRRELAVDESRARLEEQNVLLEELTVVDELTGLYNRRFLQRRLAYEWDRAGRYGRPLAIAMVDLDLFRGINERYGHRGGDVVLQAFARTSQATLRQSDLTMRYGGEEFLVIMPETDLAAADLAGERLREAVASAIVVYGDEQIRFTCSVGVAAFEAGDVDGGDIIARADAALYQAKHGGRNRVCVARRAT